MASDTSAILHGGVGYTLLPRLGGAPSPGARRHLLLEELGVVLVVLAVTSAAVWLLAPAIAERFLAGRYVLPPSLIAAALVTGNLKVLNAFARSAVAALGDLRLLARLNRLGWIAVGLSVPGAVLGSGWGLAGVIYGVGLGWVVETIVAGRWTARLLRGQELS